MAEGTIRRSNNFDAIRLLAALAVLIGHGYILTAKPWLTPGFLGLPIHQIAVAIFFAVSGYLITRSRLSGLSPAGYLVHRVFRILPGLALVVVVCALVLGPLLSSLDTAAYFAHPQTPAYLRNILLEPQYVLPGVFTDNPDAAVNGSLWSLPSEFACYLIVLAIGFLPRRAVPWALGVWLIGCAACYLALLGAGARVVVYGSLLNDAVSVWVYFAVGGILALIPQRMIRPGVAGGLLAAWLVLQALVATQVPAVVLSWLFLPYIVIAFGNARTPILRSAGVRGDFSYGIYLWGFPVQQFVFDRFGQLPIVSNLALVALLTVALAAISWFAVERPMLRLGRRIARRRTVPARAGTTVVAPL